MLIGSTRFSKYLSEAEIAALVDRLASEIRKDYAGKTLLLVCVLKGAYAFTTDLMRALKMDVEIDFVRLSKQQDTVILMKDISMNIRDKHVLIVEEIIDSGRSLRFLYDRLIQSQPASLEIVSLLDKNTKRVVEVPVKYIGRQVEDCFLVGYGLDLEERARNLPEVLSMKYPN
jgi:hypoxanthine phosphoribosyltransferase